MTNNGKIWQFGIDRGGTFTDVVAISPKNSFMTYKLLSKHDEKYKDAAIYAIRQLMAVGAHERIPSEQISSVKMGTTVATNALLERKGAKVCLVTTKGFGDILSIGYQSRPDIFALEIIKPEQLYSSVLEINERITVDGDVEKKPDSESIKSQLQTIYDKGIRSIAVVLLNSYRNDAHEKLIGEIAEIIGFEQISLSSTLINVQKIVARGDTTVADAYLNPILREYIQGVQSELGTTELKFMKSSGGLIRADNFTGKDAIISGPAGGAIAYSKISQMLGLEKVIGFDMGGTSTDVSRYDNGRCEKVYNTEISGVRIQAPMINVATVAAGGGSILDFDGQKFTVGPESAGAYPGPACYRRGGPLAVTDANLVLGKIIPEYFPKVFGKNHNESLDKDVTVAKFKEIQEKLKKELNMDKTIEEIAEGFLTIANEKMAKAIKEISVAKGFNLLDYSLFCFGGAGAQHACSIAKNLGIKKIVIHPFSGVLSAYGMVLADILYEDVKTVLMPFKEEHTSEFISIFAEMENDLMKKMIDEGLKENEVTVLQFADIRPVGTDTVETIPFTTFDSCYEQFLAHYKQRYGFIVKDKALELVSLRVEVIGTQDTPKEQKLQTTGKKLDINDAVTTVPVYYKGKWYEQTPVFKTEQLQCGDKIDGYAILIEPNSTIVVEPGFCATVNEFGHILIEQVGDDKKDVINADYDPVLLEVFNNLFMSIAEQMGKALERTAHSVNIKERLDFSCAVFDAKGGLIANAPHIPVHLGAMSESVKYVMQANEGAIKEGDVFVTNNPHHGGSHLPDVTVVTPVFNKYGDIFCVIANRGHHADIGGTTPGSMPPDSTNLEEEGVVIDNFKLISQGSFDEKGIVTLLSSGSFPARNIKERLSDLRAQIAANVIGVSEMNKLADTYTLDVVSHYMDYVQQNAEKAMRQAISQLDDGTYTASDYLDDGSELKVTVTISGSNAKIDFTGTVSQISTNLNAPLSVTKSAILYVFRTLIRAEIPLNEGCLTPLEIVVPKGSVLNPSKNAAVAGGNVETSQRVVDVIYKALNLVAASQGTMNNFTFGTEGKNSYGYYETIAGGSGAGPTFHGSDAVHTHMTNTRITDPEVLEHRYREVRVEAFYIRTNSGGKGDFNGGNGVVRNILFLKPCKLSILSERRNFAPYGINGAESGAKGENILIKKDGSTENLGGKARVSVEKGDMFSIRTPGGGGYNEVK